MTTADMQATIAQLQADNAALAAAAADAEAKVPKAKPITFKVGQKGGCSVYGLGRFPVTLYKAQWERLLGEVDNLKAFLEANDAILVTK